MNGYYYRLLQESNISARQPQGATSVIQAITGEGPYVAARCGVEPTTFRTEGTDNLHLTNHAMMMMTTAAAAAKTMVTMIMTTTVVMRYHVIFSGAM